MKINDTIEQLATYRDEIVNILQSLDGLNIDIGTKIDELEKERDENNRKGGSIPPKEFSTKHYTDSLTKDHKDDIKKDKEYNESTKRAFYKGIQ
jgi:peptidoglycan hydrolase CwlO-like protein